ncbi:MAG TPA: hypothetical protein EYN67_18265, partial [Flavobacteriales bacterium]|nr:hypothetical protein [Flavobacteriales bacterium]
MATECGFTIEEYDCGAKVETLITGDGKASFSGLNFHDEFVGIGFSYGRGTGLGVIENHKPGSVSTDIGVKWQVKFDSVKSIDA